MTEKKYLLTESDLRDISDGYNADYNKPLMEWTEWLAGHEYRERTCHVIDRGAIGACSACGEDVFADPDGYEGSYCPSCGAKVVG